MGITRIFRPTQLDRKNYVETEWIFWSTKLHRQKYVKTTWIFQPSKSHGKNYVETTWIFRPAKLNRKKYVETIWTFRQLKIRRRSTWKRRGNSAKTGLRRIDVISTSNQRRFDVVCTLGSRTLHPVKIRKYTSKIKLWNVPRRWTLNLNGQQTDRVRKNIIGVFKGIGFSLEIENNLKSVYSRHSLNLRNGTYRSCKKPNDRLLYIHSLSNHPTNVIKQIPNSVQEKLLKNSSNEDIWSKMWIWRCFEEKWVQNWF